MRVERIVAIATLWAAFAAATVCAAVPGGVEVFVLPADARHAAYEDRPVLIVRQPDPTAIVGISLDAKLGQHVVLIDSAAEGRIEHAFTVTKKSYPVQRLTLADDKMVNPPAADLARIERETTLMKDQYERFTPLVDVAVPDVAAGGWAGEFELRPAPHPQWPTAQPARRTRRGCATWRAKSLRPHAVRSR